MGFWEWGKREVISRSEKVCAFSYFKEADSHSREPPKIFDSIHWTSFRFKRHEHLHSRVLFGGWERSGIGSERRTAIWRGDRLRKLEKNVVMVSQAIETGLGPFPQLYSDSLG
jgi:hypothetical protein